MRIMMTDNGQAVGPEVVLSGRQVAVLKRRMEGRSYNEIAREMEITVSRVGQIVATLRKKGLKV